MITKIIINGMICMSLEKRKKEYGVMNMYSALGTTCMYTYKYSAPKG